METIDADSFNAISLFMRADWVVKSVMIGLAVASLWSWAVIIDKFVRLGALNRAANKFEDEVASGRALEDIAAGAGENPKEPLEKMLQGALVRRARRLGLDTPVMETFYAVLREHAGGRT